MRVNTDASSKRGTWGFTRPQLRHGFGMTERLRVAPPVPQLMSHAAVRQGMTGRTTRRGVGPSRHLVAQRSPNPPCVRGAVAHGTAHGTAALHSGVANMTYLDSVREVLGPEGFRSFCKGNALMALEDDEYAEAAKWLARLTEPSERCTSRPPSGETLWTAQCVHPVGHTDPHASPQGAWANDDDEPQRCGAIVRPSEASLFVHQCELPPGHEGEHALVRREGPTSTDTERCPARHSPSGSFVTYECNQPIGHDGLHRERLKRPIGSVDLYIWGDEPTDEELLAVLEDVVRSLTARQRRMIADRTGSTGGWVKGDAPLSPEGRVQLAEHWRAAL